MATRFNSICFVLFCTQWSKFTLYFKQISKPRMETEVTRQVLCVFLLFCWFHLQMQYGKKTNCTNKLCGILKMILLFLLFSETENRERVELWSGCAWKIKNSFGVALQRPRSAALGWISALTWAELPSFSQPLLQAMWTNYPRHTCSYICSVSAQCSRSIQGK